MWEIFDHPSDVGIKGVGSDYREAFTEAATALFNLRADLNMIESDFEVEIECDGIQTDDLLVTFLNKMLLESALNHVVLSEVKITDWSENYLKATVFGQKIRNSIKKAIRSDVKAATYYQLSVREENGSFIAQCILDI